MQAPRILIVGRNGQVARCLADAYARDATPVEILGRPEADLLEPGALRRAVAARKPSVVINAAAYTAVDRAEDEPGAAFAVNALGAEAVAAGAADCGAPVVHFSTDYVFAGDRSTPYEEGDATGPLGVYGASKLEGEQRVERANPRHVILRTAWVCSPYGNNFVKTMLRLAETRPELGVVDDQHGSPTFARDLAEATRLLVSRMTGEAPPSDAFGIFHAVNGGTATWCELARAIQDDSRLRGARHVPVRAIGTADYPTRARRPACALLATAKLQRVYGIGMRPWQAALSDCLDDLVGRPVAKS